MTTPTRTDTGPTPIELAGLTAVLYDATAGHWEVVQLPDGRWSVISVRTTPGTDPIASTGFDEQDRRNAAAIAAAVNLAGNLAGALNATRAQLGEAASELEGLRAALAEAQAQAGAAVRQRDRARAALADAAERAGVLTAALGQYAEGYTDPGLAQQAITGELAAAETSGGPA